MWVSIHQQNTVLQSKHIQTLNNVTRTEMKPLYISKDADVELIKIICLRKRCDCVQWSFHALSLARQKFSCCRRSWLCLVFIIDLATVSFPPRLAQFKRLSTSELCKVVLKQEHCDVN